MLLEAERVFRSNGDVMTRPIAVMERMSEIVTDTEAFGNSLPRDSGRLAPLSVYPRRLEL